ncbi:MAG TPA: ATP-binding protein [Kofleriaceae bacterium]|nr:ATP-binding protein [Kofleriaceae bacterium]
MGWRAWPLISDEYRRGERRPRYFWYFHVPLVAAFVALFWVPAIARWSGVDPRFASIALGLQLVYLGIYVHTKIFERAPVLWSTVAATMNLGLVTGIAATTGRPSSPLWSLVLVYVMVAAQAFGLTVYFLVLVAAAPFIVAGIWHGSGAVPVSDSAGPMAVVALLSIVAYLFLARTSNEQRQARNELEAIRQSAAIDGERQRIARELHTTIGAALTEVSLWLDVAVAGRDQVALGRAHRRTREALLELRACVASMDRAETAADTLEKLIRSRLLGLCDAAAVELDLRFVSELPTLPATSIYHAAKLVHEAALNAIRHGQPRHLEIEVLVDAGGHLAIDVTDDGAGFDLEATPLGRGVVAMREHAQALGAALTVQSTADRGTRVTARRLQGQPA